MDPQNIFPYSRLQNNDMRMFYPLMHSNLYQIVNIIS